jgi:hypothetical protein
MWPLGGLAFCDVPRLVWPEFVTVVCGPLVTLFLLVGAAALRSFEFTFDLFTGWQSPYQMWAEPRAWIDLVYLVNYALFMFNLIPMYPMDMGRIAQCAMWPWLGYRKSMAAATTLGMIAAVVLGLWALVNSAYMVLAIALFGYLTCYQERQLVQAGIRTEDGYMGYDFSGGYTTLEGKRERSAGFIARWRRKRADAARRRQQVSAETEQQEVDRILEKVHREGLQSLTRSEKRTLQMATKRQQDSSRHRV